ncbi:MAG: low molecular weight phosphotyrosine protein phosphatase [Solirubrobacterales bacterium]|nr:low molecular weight phosphotyrosine protein phosphatase [Solirubrobacterales bacterium]
MPLKLTDPVSATPVRILFVCLGNICRSPTAEAMMKDLVEREGLGGQVEVDSAGTGAWHVGNPPDPRAIETAARRGIEMNGAARQVTASDFDDFDLIVAMDSSNHFDLLALSGRDNPKVRLLREIGGDELTDVPDPYYGGDDGFEDVLDIVERGCRALLEEVRP